MGYFKCLALTPLLMLIVSCSEDNKDEEGSLSGPCVHTYSDALITIVSVKEVSTGYQLSGVNISGVIQYGRAVNFNEVSLENDLNFTVDSDGSGGYCTMPCSFLDGEGEITFVVSANGYLDKKVDLVGVYQLFEGGCPSYSSGGMELNLELEVAS